MAKKIPQEKKIYNNPNVVGLRAEVLEQPITETLETNYMPYAMSVIVSRAIPEIDGFKPSHRKLLYTMFKMGLLTGARTKSANIVGQTMRLNPHGDAAIYETMVRLSAGYQALLTPFVDSKGNFGKVFSRDMSYAASRYTEAKLSAICAELFRDIDKDTVDLVDNYDGSMKEPSLLPTAFPNVLVSANMGIAVGMASQICGFNLAEVCDATVAWLRDPEHDLLSTMPAPDFPTGGEIDLRPRADGEHLPHGARQLQGAGALALYPEREHNRDIRNTVYHDLGSDHRQGRGAYKDGEDTRDKRHARRDRPERSAPGYRPQARSRPRQAHAEALPHDDAPGRIPMQLQYSRCGQPSRDGRG